MIKRQRNKEDLPHEFCISFGNCAHDKATPVSSLMCTWVGIFILKNGLGGNGCTSTDVFVLLPSE